MNSILKTIFSLFLIISYNYGYTQTGIQGKIIHKETGVSIAGATINNTKNNFNSKSFLDGSFEVKEEGLYIISKNGYFKNKVKITKGSLNIIQLTENPSELSEIIINSNYLPKTIRESSASINIISKTAIESGNTINFNEILNKTPGVFMQSGALNTNRITIRGIGSRTLFGTSKIRAYFKEIPLTSGSGETNIEDLELGAISKLEIIKGASSIYGAGLGGTIQLIPKNGNLNNNYLEKEFSFGSFGLLKSIIKINHGNNKNSYKAIYSNTNNKGYRDNNNYDRQTFTLNTNHFINTKNNLSILASHINLKAFIPSSLDEVNFKDNPKSAAFTWNQAKGFEDSQRGLIGISWEHKYHNNLQQSTSIFSSYRKGYEPRPFNILKEKTWAYGFRSRLIGNINLFNKELQWIIGGETFKDTYKWNTFQNLYQDFPQGHGSVKGNELSSFKEKRKYFNLFLETNYKLSPITNISLGLNYNQTSYDLLDRFIISETNPDQSGQYKYKGIISPKFGLTHTISKKMILYSNISHGFSPLSLEETLLPDGQINTQLEPETGWNYEIGSRSTFLKNRLHINLALFSLKIRNLVVARRISENQFTGLNAGKTEHNGLELNINYTAIQNEKLSINTVINTTHNNFSFKNFIDGENDFSGNDLTGVPPNIFNAIIDTNFTSGFYGNINFQYVDSMPITDSNNIYSNSYSLTNLKMGYKTKALKTITANIYFGLNNIFNTAYASQILINASSFGGQSPRYFYPGNPLNYYTGINLNYNF